MTRLYPVRYKIQLGSFSIEAAGEGGADSLFLATIIRDEDGSDDISFVSVCGATREGLSDVELFGIFSHLAKAISEGTGPDWQRRIAAAAFTAAQTAVSGAAS